MNILEFNPGACVLGNGVYLTSFVLLVEVGAIRTWHYYGTLVPSEFIDGIPAVQHNAIQVNLDNLDLVESAQRLGKDSALAALTA